MKCVLYLEARREGYAIDQISETMTVGDIIEYLTQFEEDTPVYLSHDGGYTYGGIIAKRFEEEWIEEEDEEEN